MKNEKSRNCLYFKKRVGLNLEGPAQKKADINLCNLQKAQSELAFQNELFGEICYDIIPFKNFLIKRNIDLNKEGF